MRNPRGTSPIFTGAGRPTNLSNLGNDATAREILVNLTALSSEMAPGPVLRTLHGIDWLGGDAANVQPAKDKRSKASTLSVAQAPG